MPNICAVVVTFNRKQVLAEELRTILAGELLPEKILVVDNASTDGTMEFLQETFGSAVTVLRLPRNVGGAGGFKAGIAAAVAEKHDFIWVMDDDHILEPPVLRRLYESLEKYQADVAGPVLLSPARDGSLAWEMGPGTVGYRDYPSLVRDFGTSGTIPQVPATFNAVLYRRSVFEKVGLPDERLFIRGDEIDFGLRLQQHNIKAFAVTDALVYHPIATNEYYSVMTIGKAHLLHVCYTGNPLKDYCLMRNRAYYYKRYGLYKNLFLDPVKYFLFFFVNRRFDFKGFRFWLRAFCDGLFQRFGHERQFIRA